MNSLLNSLQSSLGALLAIELAVVALLCVTLLWLLSRRKESSSTTEQREPLSAAEAEVLEARLAELEGVTQERTLLAAENEVLRQRNDALETSLKEYEMVREEIAQISSLKLENRRLKEAMGLLPSLPTSPAETPFKEPTRLRDV